MAGPLGALNYLPFAGGLAGGGGTAATTAAGGGTAATTAAGGAGLAALGPWMLGATALSTVGGLIGGSQQANSQAQQTQLQGLFTKLAPINQSINYAGQELMASMAPYLGAQAAQTNLIGQSVYDMFTGARSKEAQQAGVQTAMAYGTGQALTDVIKTAAMGKVATGLKGMETQAGLVEKSADVLGLQYTNLAKGITDVGTSAANMRNKLLENQQIANLETAKGLALERGRGEREEMHRRSARSAALNAGGFA